MLAQSSMLQYDPQFSCILVALCYSVLALLYSVTPPRLAAVEIPERHRNPRYQSVKHEAYFIHIPECSQAVDE